MSACILRKSRSNKGFTIFEVITASFITLYVVMGVWAIYILGWSQWHEIEPQLDAQKITRAAIASIVDGTRDSTAGTFSIGGASLYRRNGIAQAVATPDTPNAQTIDFRLETDASNVRSFYLGTDPVSGAGVVYYKDNSGVASMIDATKGINSSADEYGPGLVFTPVSNNLVRVTSKVERDIEGTRSQKYHIKVEYSELVFLRSVPNS